MKIVRLFVFAVILLCNTAEADWVDNFDGNEPDQVVWTFVNPLGDGAICDGWRRGVNKCPARRKP